MTDRYAILVRHGEYQQKPGTPSALQPFALTKTGKTQALDVGRELAALARTHGFRLSAEICCSRQQRAWQTATLLARTLSEEAAQDLHVTEDEALAERSVGAFANLTIPEIEQILIDDPRYEVPPENWKSNSHYKLPAQGAESLMDAGQRVAAFLSSKTADLSGAPGPDTRIFVGHGASLRHAAHFLGVLHFDEIRHLSMHYAKPVVLKRGANDIWTHHSGAWKERRVLETAID
ncbi:histidine phosphatase family protein [Roseibium aggregatum]|uniref:phosphoglycerate mutase (2,3-diphosphoglycerate-dependent) n=1 Tax=Roseibium aggregatum TaxID=187304 RepID=A0A939EG60_9HYPH|nr:histidine phosphatase family protein [Roseibium aggregatum]MBN9671872.1 histidine phosphatase family protein [Roseibium aggregatum]